MLLLDFIDRQFIHNNPPDPTISFKDKTVIVTGANVGLGKEACRKAVQLGASLVVLAGRNVDKGNAAAKDIQASTSCSPSTLQVWPLDLASYASVITFGDRVRNDLTRLDVLISNAGRGTQKFNVTEGNEESLTTNVVCLFLHAFLLLPKLHQTAVKYNTKSHFTVTASELYEVAKFKESKAPAGQLFATLNDETTANMGDRYNVTKLIEVLVVKQMAELYPVRSGKVVMNCVAPGMCATDLGRDFTYNSAAARVAVRLLGRPAEVGARTLVHGACAGPESHGQYLPDCKIAPLKGIASGKGGTQLQQRVWMELKQKLEVIRQGVTDVQMD